MTIKGLGRLKDPADERDYSWRAYVPQAVANEIDLPDAFIRPDPGPVLNQGDQPQCVAYTAASVKAEEEWRETHDLRSFDPDPLYKRCKELDGIPNEDGTYPRIMLGVLKDEGFAADDGQRYHISDYVRCETVRQIKEALFLDGPVALGMQIDSQWSGDKIRNGMIGEPNGDVLGGHETTIFGWNDHAGGRGVGALYIKNSWGEEWGDGGFAYLPYTHLERYRDFDAWKVIDVANLAQIIAPTMNRSAS